MPETDKVGIDIELSETGAQEVGQQYERVFNRISTASAKTEAELKKSSQGMALSAQNAANPYAVAARQIEDSHSGISRSAAAAALSNRDFSRGLLSVSQILGQVNPMFAVAALRIGDVTERLSGGSRMAGMLAKGAVGVGLAVAAMMKNFEETERIATQFAAIDRAIKGLDFSAVRQGLQETGIQIESLDRQMHSWVGSFQQYTSAMIRTVLLLPNAFEEANEKMERLRAGLQTILSIQMAQEAAAHGVEMGGLRIQARQQSLQSLLSRGLAGERSVGLHAGRLRQEIEGAAQEAEAVLGYQRRKEFAEAGARGTLDIESEAIQKRYKQRLEELQAKRDIQLFGVEEQARQQVEGVRGRAESQRAFGAQGAIERQQAYVESLKAEGEAAKKIQAANEEYMKRIGVPPWMMATVDPRAKQLIEEEKRARLMAIDETLQKNLWSIEQLKTADAERARLVGQATATAETQRTTAIEQSRIKENELYDTAQKLRDELWKAGQAVQTSLVPGLDQAAAAAKEAADAASVIGMSGSDFQSKPGQPSEAWKRFWGPAAPGAPGSKEWWAWPSWTGRPMPAGWQPGQPTGPSPAPAGPDDWTTRPIVGPIDSPLSEWPALQHGGVVPGPIGRPRPIIAHGGEFVLNREQQEATFGGRISAPISITVNGSQEDPEILARRIAHAVGRELARAAALGRSAQPPL